MLVACLAGVLLLQAAAPQLPETPGAAVDARVVPHRERVLAPSDTNPRRRPRAIEYSDWYYRRLLIHRWGSYVELPIFAGEYYLGQRLIEGTSDTWVRPAHIATSVALGGLFGINTITGVWNLWESRASTDQRALIWTHSALMLVSDAGFAITPMLVNHGGGGANFGRTHKQVAMASMGIATLATVIMWFGVH